MENYKSNSHKSREELRNSAPDKKAGKVITGDVTIKKKNEIRKFADTFISEDAPNVMSYIVNDIVVPAIKDTFFDIITNGLAMTLFGGTDKVRKTSSGSKRSYSDYYKSDKERHIVEEPRSRSRFDYDEIIIRTRGDAENVLAEMDDYIANYKVVSVLDLYDMLGRTAPYTADRYGWTDIRNAYARRVRDGYKLELPRPMPLD